jgi:hypothetical protein
MNIETINIIVSTNASNEKEFSLTKNAVYHPTITDTSKYSEYPFFTKYVDYSVIRGDLDSLSYKDLVDTFFIKTLFEKKMKIAYKKNLVNNENMNTYANINVNIMLSLLFPTTYPVKNNYENTFDTLIGSTNLNNVNVSFNMKNIFSFFISNQYSYIKHSSNTYSIVKCVWLNDFFNHPKYFKLIDEYKKLLTWKVAENKKLNEGIYQKIKALINYLKQKEVQETLTFKNDVFKQTEPYSYSSYHNNNKTNMKNEINTLISSISQLINTINNEKSKDTKKLKELFDNSLQSYFNSIINNYNKLFEKVIDRHYEYSKYTLTGSIKNQLDSVISKYKEIKTDKKILEDYITDKQYHPINFIYTNENMKNSIEKYSQITNFKNLLKSYVEPNQKSTNYKLQDEIENFQKGYENVLQDIMNPSNLLVNKSEVDKEDVIDINSIRDYLNVGVCFSTPSSESNETKEPVNEIYIKLFIIKGELNDENKNILNCMYKGNYLGDELQQLLTNDKSQFLLNVSDFQFDINSKEAKDKIRESVKATEKTNAISNAPPVKPKQRAHGGSRRRQKKRRRRTKKTRKSFFI